jgi:hypothetical protein
LLFLLLLLLLRSPSERMQDSNHCAISSQNADSNGSDYGEAENERHEERDQDQPPCQNFNIRFRNPSLRIATHRGFFNLPALTVAASDDPDSA